MSRHSCVLLAAALCAALLLGLAPMALSAPGSGPPPGWRQTAKNGIDNPNNTALFPFTCFNGRQYFWIPQTGDPQNAPAAPVWTYDGNKFVKAAPDGFGDPRNCSISPGSEFQGRFYLGTLNINGAQLWSSADGLHFQQVGLATILAPGDYTCTPMGIQGGRLLVEIDNYNGSGCKVWAYDGTTFTRANTDGFGLNVQGLSSAVLFQGRIHVLSSSRQNQVNPLPEVALAYQGGTTWTPTAPEGFGDANNMGSYVAVTNGTYIYTGTDNQNGAQVWRFDGSSWTKVNIGAIGSPSNNMILVTLFKGKLMVAATYLSQNGPPSRTAQIYVQKPDGSFGAISLDGFGDTNNLILVLGPPHKRQGAGGDRQHGRLPGLRDHQWPRHHRPGSGQRTLRHPCDHHRLRLRGRCGGLFRELRGGDSEFCQRRLLERHPDSGKSA